MASVTNDWPTELGFGSWRAPAFIRSAGELETTGREVLQVQALRRAFAELALDGVACMRGAPLVYFKELDRFDPEQVQRFHRLAWNQGLASVLVLLTTDRVFVYSAVATPAKTIVELSSEKRLIEILDRVADAMKLRRFALAIETGEYLRVHAEAFDPMQRVDWQLLANLTVARKELLADESLDPATVDILLCRIVFTCYLIDRKIIGTSYFEQLGLSASRLQDVLALEPTSRARAALYKVFDRLKRDFNSDLFSSDVASERKQLNDEHIQLLLRMLGSDDLASGQLRLGFWAYDFSVIPIEAISAIYENFIRQNDDGEDARSSPQRSDGAFYTPRFLAEIVVELATTGMSELLNSRFLDPACGSGIFLVALFQRLAERWRVGHPTASYDERVAGLIGLLQKNLVGVDKNPVACRITVFSLYLALLDQLSPPDIQKLQQRGHILPKLLMQRGQRRGELGGNTIINDDFASVEHDRLGGKFDLVIGNPPWISRNSRSRDEPEPLLTWCNSQSLPYAQGQIAYGFVWKASAHTTDNGRVCLVLPYSILFNHDDRSLRFQQAWLTQNSIDAVVNLADLRFLLFDHAIKPALVIRYRSKPSLKDDQFDYFAPKTSIPLVRTEVMDLEPEDRSRLKVGVVLAALRSQRESSPGRGVTGLWKERSWGTPRDWKFLERLSELAPLSVVTGQVRGPKKRWMIGEGFQPMGRGDAGIVGKDAWPKQTLFIEADNDAIDLILRRDACRPIGDRFGRLRRRPNEQIFQPPHVLVSKGMRVAYCDFDVVFRHALRGISGPTKDAKLLMFLSAYLDSDLAKYFWFHSTANFGMERPEVHVSEVLRTPFPISDDPACIRLVEQVAELMRSSLKKTSAGMVEGAKISALRDALRPLVYAYFDVDENEAMLIEDTREIARPSATPRRSAAMTVPSLRPSTTPTRAAYVDVLCNVLSTWSRGPRVAGVVTHVPGDSGAIVTLGFGKEPTSPSADAADAFERLSKIIAERSGALRFGRGLNVFDGDRLYVAKPLATRFWTRTAALNDADELAQYIISGRGQRREWSA